MSKPFTSSKFRSKEAAAVLRSEEAEHSDFNLSKWTKLAIADMAQFAHLQGSTNGNERRTYFRAARAVREGVELFALRFWPSCKDWNKNLREIPASDRDAFFKFLRGTEKDIIDMAVLEANAE